PEARRRLQAGVLPARKGARRSARPASKRQAHRSLRLLQARAGDERAQSGRAADRAEVLRARSWRDRGNGGEGTSRGVQACERDAAVESSREPDRCPGFAPGLAAAALRVRLEAGASQRRGEGGAREGGAEAGAAVEPRRMAAGAEPG